MVNAITPFPIALRILDYHKKPRAIERGRAVKSLLQVLFSTNNEAVPVERLQARWGRPREERALDEKEEKQDQMPGAAEQSDDVFTHKLAQAMRHPLRVEILGFMNERPWSPRELERETGKSLSDVSYHVKVLKDLELIEETHSRPVRGATEHFYRAISRAYVSPEMARHIPKSTEEMAGNIILREIDKDLGKSFKAGTVYRRDDWHGSWTPLIMDDLGCKEAEAIAVQAVKDIIEAAERAASRLAEGESKEEPIPIGLAIFLYGRAEKTKRASKKRKASKKTAG
jgi:DNA-binding transcriptional ArsR family regulator